MHICFLCNEYPPEPHGGVGSFTQTMARALARRGHRVSVIGYTVTGRGTREVDRGVHVIRLPHARIPGTGLLVNPSRMWRAILDLNREAPIDVIEGPEGSFAGLPRALPTATVIRMHGGHHFFAVTLGRSPRLQRSWIERRSFARASHLCAVSQFVARTTLRLLDQSHRAVQVLPNPVDVELFAPRSTEEEPDLIVFAGTVCEKKGVRQLVQAMPAILDAVPRARLLITGRDSRDRSGGSFSARLQASLPAAVGARVAFTGPVPHVEMPSLLARAAVCVYPSHMEALPLAWLEGMAMARPVVASRTGPGPEVIEDGVSGLLCDPHDPSAIAARVIAALRSPGLRRQLGAQARARVMRLFSEEVLIGRNEQFYESCRAHPLRRAES